MSFFIFAGFFLRAAGAKQRLQLVLIVCLGLSAVVVVTDEVFWQRMATLNEVEDESASGSHRYRLWLDAVDMVDTRPFGLGAGGYMVLSPQYVDEGLFHKGQQQKAVHSTWFQSLSEVGWLGLIIFLFLLYSSYSLSKKTKRYLKEDMTRCYFINALQASLITFLIAGTFINRYRAEVLYWLLLFIACAWNIYVNLPEKEVKAAKTTKR